MSRQHSYHRLYYHLVFSTKNRESFICSKDDERMIDGLLKEKAHDLHVIIEEFGSWYDHVHLLVRCVPSIELSKVYRHLKGYSTWVWRRRFPDRPFGWSDGVFAATVDPDQQEELRAYIRNQRNHHQSTTTQPRWEATGYGLEFLDSPPGLGRKAS